MRGRNWWSVAYDSHIVGAEKNIHKLTSSLATHFAESLYLWYEVQN